MDNNNIKDETLVETSRTIYKCASISTWFASFGIFNFIMTFFFVLTLIIINNTPGKLSDDSKINIVVFGIFFGLLDGITFLGTFICSLLIAKNSNFLKENYNLNIQALAIVSMFLGVFTSFSLLEKIRRGLGYQAPMRRRSRYSDQYSNSTLNDPYYHRKKYNSFNCNNNAQQTMYFDNNQEINVPQDVFKNNINNQHLNTNQEILNDIPIKKSSDVNELKEKLEKIEKIWKEGLISDSEYYNLKEKIIVES